MDVMFFPVSWLGVRIGETASSLRLATAQVFSSRPTHSLVARFWPQRKSLTFYLEAASFSPDSISQTLRIRDDHGGFVPTRFNPKTEIEPPWERSGHGRTLHPHIEANDTDGHGL